MLLIIGVALFFNLVVVCLLIFRWRSHKKQAVSLRMDQYLAPDAPYAAKTDDRSEGMRRLSGWRSVVRWLGGQIAMSDGSWSKRMEHRLIQAGLPLKSQEFLVICLGSSLAIGCVLMLKNGLPGALLGGICGYGLPFVYLKIKIKRRAKAFNDQLGDTLILIANALRTGYSFMQAIEMVAREMLPPIAVEFARTLKEMNLGVPTEEAMLNMARRVDSDDLDLVITAVLIQRQVGGNLAEVLDSIATTIRERIRIKGEIKTLTAQGRMSGVIVSLLPIALLFALKVINPGYIDLLFTHPFGQTMLGAAVLGQIMGIVVIQKIVNIEI
ncbi:type II secretion system F family protein [Sporomusa acidovorans]|uniref:Type II secretion system protein GspF domain-containing protein n=1 Tax=Sporomusa acidovorans (strain ATCC 49682 / DSM 3132 / Mol) TaxID=1123286 RepID=A0ABZ3IWM0_SPOA4|nr:type II secretion system F family protein [Sporomusa acidovorans]OZC13982.1 bacterial type II secretion system protein F domain protein [Sporomusa acidovorans DSM 3132]SDF21730.1 tight adherence protein B [Sporomusa acidovorans]